MSRSALGSVPVQGAGELIVSSQICPHLVLAREHHVHRSVAWRSGATALQRLAEQ